VTGRGLFTREWHHAHDAGADHAEQVVAWAKDVLGTCRRPWGIASFDLEIAANNRRYASFRRLEPADLYAPDFVERLRAHLAHASGGAPLTAHLFSWGDAVHWATGPGRQSNN
jgi:hypothetical protein